MRFAHEHCGILRVEISRDSKDARALVDAVIAAIDEPRALLGCDRRGGAVMLFRAEKDKDRDLVPGDGWASQLVLGARNRLAAFRAKQKLTTAA